MTKEPTKPKSTKTLGPNRLIDIVTLSLRWGVSTRTASRYCTLNGIQECFFVRDGRKFYPIAKVRALEDKVILQKNSRKKSP